MESKTSQEEAKSAASEVTKFITGEVNVDVTESRNPRGIPKITFIENVPDFLQAKSTTIEDAIQAFNVIHSKYKFMETNLQQSKLNYKRKIPDIEKSLELVRTLRKKKEESQTMDTHFSLSDLVYASAKVEPVDHVCLWLGADVMLEYSLDDAEALLTKNLETAKNKLDQIDEDLDFLRDQTITTEVNVARVFNYDVKIRREKGEISK